MSNTKPQQQVPGAVVAVLGGGYAGLFAAHRAARAITKARHSGAAVVLVDADDAWQERTRWHQVAAGETVQSRSRARIFRGTRVATVTGTVTEAIITATVCVLLVLLHLRTSFIIAITLPLAVLASFAVMWTLRRLGVADIQTNIMSLAGLAIHTFSQLLL